MKLVLFSLLASGLLLIVACSEQSISNTLQPLPNEVSSAALKHLQEEPKLLAGSSLYEIRDFKVLKYKQMELTDVDKANEVNEKWILAPSYLRRYRQTSSNEPSDWEAGGKFESLIVEKRTASWKVRTPQQPEELQIMMKLLTEKQ